MASFFTELKRRNVFKVGVAYAIVAWLIIQIVAVFNAPLNLPEWFDTVVAVLLIIGFPLALIFAWAFELTPEGLKTSKSVEPAESITKETGQKLNYTIIGLLSLAVVFMFLDNYVLELESKTLDTQVSTEQVTVSEPESRESDRLPNSVAILPFENLSLDPENAFFAAGIYESTLNQLSTISGLRVMSRTSVVQFEENPPPVTEIAEKLNVETVMEGSVRYGNGRVLITAQLIDGLSGIHLWSKEFNMELADVFSVQAEVAREIASALQVQLLPEERANLTSRPTESDEAYQHYLYGLSLSRRAEYDEVFRLSMERAVEADPNFAEAYALLAQINDHLGNIDAAMEFAYKALELNPELGRAYRVLGYNAFDYYGRQEEAISYLERAVKLSPNDPDILGIYCLRLADYKNNNLDIIPICKRTIEIEPTMWESHRVTAFALMRAGELEEAVREIQEAIEINPDEFFEPYLDYAMMEYLKGNNDVAKSNLDKAIEIMAPNNTFRADYIAYVYGLLGYTEIAENLLTRFDSRMTENDRMAGRTLGWGILGTRDKERSLEEWQTVIDGYINEGWPVSPGRIHRFRDNWLNDSMLEEPEFLELRRRLGFNA